MKKTICITLVIALVCNVLMSGCASRSMQPVNAEERPSSGSNMITTGNSAGSGDPATVVSGNVMKLGKKSRVGIEEMSSGYNGFALRALKQAITTGSKEGENLMISPASLMFALDMAAMGAKGKTYKQIAKLFTPGMSKYPTKKDLTAFAKQYRKKLEKSGMMDIANSIWINENNLKENEVRISEGYLNLLRKQYKAAADSLAFNDEAKARINEWISEKTKGMIKDAVDDLSDESLMLIVNAMAFEGVWKQQYDASSINQFGDFTNSDGKKERAKMLSSVESWYLHSDDATGFLKYYEGDKYAFMAMLPNDKDISINDYIKGLEDDALEKFYNSMSVDEVDTIIPAFSFDYDIEMNDMLKNMGMKKAFDKKADFFSMLDPQTVNPQLLLYIGSVIQKTHVELDEKGTKAAAVTIIDFKCETTAVREPEPRKRVILDRPFAFAIMDTETGTPVFMGVVNTVNN